MNYRHQFHAGNFADVVKHVVLGQLVQGLARKDKGFLFLDTHAGRGRYDLEAAARGDTLVRRPEWPDGVGRLVGRADVPEAVGAYLRAVQAFDRQAGHLGDGLRFYPGSPRLAKGWLRPQDRLMLCELNEAEAAALAGEFGRERGVSVQRMDGYAAIRAALPPPEKRALVLIDPPFESSDEWRRLVEALAEGLRRLPGATFALWFPQTERARVERFFEELLALSLPATWVAEVSVADESAGLKMRGCGLVVVNPPWQLAADVAPVLRWLATVLAQGPGAEGAVRWLVPER